MALVVGGQPSESTRGSLTRPCMSTMKLSIREEPVGKNRSKNEHAESSFFSSVRAEQEPSHSALWVEGRECSSPGRASDKDTGKATDLALEHCTSETPGNGVLSSR